MDKSGNDLGKAQAELIDLSADGLRLENLRFEKMAPAFGSFNFEVHFVLPSGQKIKGKYRVVRFIYDRDKILGVGIETIELSKEHQKKIDKFVRLK